MKVRTSVLSRYALNILLDRRDLLGASMTSIPYALSRRAFQTLGADILAVPPKAQTVALMKGLRVEAVHRVDVRISGVGRKLRHGFEPGKEQSLRDHLAAIQWFLEHTDPRSHYQNLDRQSGKVRN